MTRLSAFVASLACSVKRAAVGRRTVTRNMTLQLNQSCPLQSRYFTHQLSTGVAFHGLRLAISCIMIWPTALVARCGSVSRNVESATSLKASSPPKPSAIATSSWCSRHRLCCGIGIRAVPSQVSRLSAGVAIATSSLPTDPQGWTVSLNVTKALAVIALLSCVSVSSRFSIGIRDAHYRLSGEKGTGWTHGLAACNCNKAVRWMCTPRHSGPRCHICSMLDAKETTWRLSVRLIVFYINGIHQRGPRSCVGESLICSDCDAAHLSCIVRRLV